MFEEKPASFQKDPPDWNFWKMLRTSADICLVGSMLTLSPILAVSAASQLSLLYTVNSFVTKGENAVFSPMGYERVECTTFCWQSAVYSISDGP